MKLFEKIFQILCSLRMAVVVILTLAAAMAVATIIESTHDTQTAQYWIYRATWFHAVLGLLGLTIFCVAISRLPWRKKHIPFLLAHAGILILLMGSWMTDKWGIDAQLRVSEGETVAVTEMDTASLIIADQQRVYSVPIRWTPPDVTFKTMDLSSSKSQPYKLRIDGFLSHADPLISFIPNPYKEVAPNLGTKKPPFAAVRFLVKGGPMKISQEFWLWQGAPSWQEIQAGPARFAIGESSIAKDGEKKASISGPKFTFKPEEKGAVSYLALSSAGKKVTGTLSKNKLIGSVIHPGWKGDVTLTVLEWVPDAVASTTYKPSRIQYGNEAPPSAIHVSGIESSESAEGVGGVGGAKDNGSDVWLGLGDRALIHLDGQELQIAYMPKRIVLPFSIRLEKFTVEHDPGTLTPSSYSSRVTAIDKDQSEEVVISMNEPLEKKGYTLYQASYEDGDPRPVTSIFTVNRDPGRYWKYLGSFLIVLGSVLLFAGKYKRAKLSNQVPLPRVTKELEI